MKKRFETPFLYAQHELITFACVLPIQQKKMLDSVEKKSTLHQNTAHSMLSRQNTFSAIMRISSVDLLKIPNASLPGIDLVNWEK